MAPRELRMLPVLATDPGSVANMQIGQLPAACTLNSKGYDYLFRPSWAPAHTLNTHKQVGTFPETKNKLIFKCIVWWKSRHRDTELQYERQTSVLTGDVTRLNSFESFALCYAGIL